MERILVETSDGSHTLFVPSLNEHYHSVHGALQESRHVFIQSGFQHIQSPVIKIFEVGFGTGLNALLTFIEAEKLNQRVIYHAIEPYPLPRDILENLNYMQHLEEASSRSYFHRIHDARWNRQHALSDNFTLKKLAVKFNRAYLYDNYNLVYFDAFAPEKQAELWTVDIFTRLFQAMVSNGVLVTYSAKGEVKRNLKAAGFLVESLKGPPGKREMIRAIKA